MRFILSSPALVGTVLATLTGLVLYMAMGANAKPPEIRILKFWMVGISLLSLTGVGVGVLLMRSVSTTSPTRSPVESYLPAWPTCLASNYECPKRAGDGIQ